MEGVDGVVHLASWFYVGPGPDHVETAEGIDVDGTQNVLDLFGELDILRGVYTSPIGVYGDTGGERIDESYESSDPLPGVYFRTKWEAHYEVVKPMMENGLPMTIVLPGVVFGRYDKEYGSARAAMRNYLQGDLPFIPRGFVAPWEHAEDTAGAHIQAMEAGEPGEDYITAPDPVSMVEVFEHAEDITGIPAPRAVSPRVFSALARVMDVVERVSTPPKGLEAENLRFLAGNKIPVDNTKAKRKLGIEHRPLAEGLRDYLEWEMDQLGIQREANL
jgi:dihydroflavonol-4-reductase